MHILLALLALFLIRPAQAAQSAIHASPRASVSLLSDTDEVGAGVAYHVGLRFQLQPGWHIYGRNPGDAGVPAELEWQKPEGTVIGPIAWPAPQRLPEGPLMTFGYTGGAVLVMVATGPGPLTLKASWLICNLICVPEEAEFHLDLPSGTPAPSKEAGLFALAATRLPRPAPWVAGISAEGGLTITGEGAEGVREAWFAADAPDVVQAAAMPPLRRVAGGFSLALATAEKFRGNMPLSGVLTATDAGGGVSAWAVTAMPGVAVAATPLWQALLSALLGGLILNLMPCVFPVLAMKAFAILRLSGESRARVRAEAWAYLAGVLATFAAIGLGLLGLRALGQSLGWGFQFQSPIFVAVMAWVLFAVGLNLSGVFSIETQLAGTGQGLTLRGGRVGSFFAGMLAVLVATPCTAPFMGVAIAAALAAPPVVTLAVFLAMGLGLAAPTLLLALIPGVARALPRPGRWMEVLRQGLAFPMYAAAAWLLWVASLQAGASAVLIVAAGLVLTGLAAWALQFGPRVGRGVAIACCAALLASLPALNTAEAPATDTAERFTPDRLAALRAEGKPVLVNMTAAWCVTCLVNERVALSAEAVQAALRARQITYLKGDWTRQDPSISSFLQANDADGVPLYVYYPPDHGAKVILPQILTPSVVLRVLGSDTLSR